MACIFICFVRAELGPYALLEFIYETCQKKGLVIFSVSSNTIVIDHEYSIEATQISAHPNSDILMWTYSSAEIIKLLKVKPAVHEKTYTHTLYGIITD